MAVKKRKLSRSRGSIQKGFHLSKKGAWLAGIALFCMAAWMFVLGLLVGRGTVPVSFNGLKLQKELTARRNATLQAEQKRFKIQTALDPKKTDLQYPEALKQTSVASKPATAKPKPKRALTKKSVTAVKPPKDKKSAVLATKHPSRHKAGAKTLPDKPRDTTDASKDYTIQVASLKDPAMADKLVTDLKQKGYPAYRAIGKIPGKGIWHRVRVGHFNHRKQANGTLNRLKSQNIDCFVVKK